MSTIIQTVQYCKEERDCTAVSTGQWLYWDVQLGYSSSIVLIALAVVEQDFLGYTALRTLPPCTVNGTYERITFSTTIAYQSIPQQKFAPVSVVAVLLVLGIQIQTVSVVLYCIYLYFVVACVPKVDRTDGTTNSTTAQGYAQIVTGDTFHCRHGERG